MVVSFFLFFSCSFCNKYIIILIILTISFCSCLRQTIFKQIRNITSCFFFFFCFFELCCITHSQPFFERSNKLLVGWQMTFLPFRLFFWRASWLGVTAGVTGIFALGCFFAAGKLLHYQLQHASIPLFNADAVVLVEEHARYPCEVFDGYSVVVYNHYVRIAGGEILSGGKEDHESWWMWVAFKRLLTLFSNETHTVTGCANYMAPENQLNRVREFVGDSRGPVSVVDSSLASSSSFVASSTWPEGTAKYAAITIEPLSPLVNDGSLNALRSLADRATHQSLVRCDPFAPAEMNCAGDASYLAAPYLRVMLSAFILLPFPFPRLRVAVLGVGGGSLPSFLQHYFSRDIVKLDLVDAEPMCFWAAVKDLGLREKIPGGVVTCHVCDGAEFLQNVLASEAIGNDAIASHRSTRMFNNSLTSVREQSCAHCYDVMFVDLFLGSESPAFVSSLPFLQLCQDSLSSVGVVAFNLPAADSVFLSNCRRVFGRDNVFCLPVPASANTVVLARRGVSGLAGTNDGVYIARRHFYRRAKVLQKSYGLPYDIAAHYPLLWRMW